MIWGMWNMSHELARRCETRMPGRVSYFVSNYWPADVDPQTQPTNHSPFFSMHEPHMEVGVKAFAHMVVDYLKSQ